MVIHFPSQKIPLEGIYAPDSDLFPVSGPWVAVGWRTEDKSGLFSLTGNRRTEQHLSSLIHYPPLHLARLGLHTSSFGPFSRTDRTLDLPNITHVHKHAHETQEPGISLTTIYRFKYVWYWLLMLLVLR